MRTLSAATRRELHAQQTSAALITLLTVRVGPASARRTVRLTDAPAGVTSRGQRYTSLPVRLVLPGASEDGASNARIEIDNVSDEIGSALRQSNEVDLDIEIVLSSDPQHVEISWQGIELEQVQWDAGLISATLRYPTFDKEPYPALRFTPATAPGIF